MPTLLEMRGITKSFPGVRALDGVTFSLGAGELHALVGENGAGKSTLMKVLGGVYPYPEYEGEIVVDGRERRFRGVHDAEAAGVAVVYQELSLVKELTIGENVFLGREPSRAGFVRWEELYARTARLLDELHLDLDPRASAGALGVGRQQLVEIAKALSHDARILVLDEPTAALADAEVETLFAILERLRARGVGIVYISHRLEEVFRIADTITVLRDGRTVATHRAADLDEPRVISLMVGREVNSIFPERRHDAGEVALEARGVTVEDPDTPGRRIVDGVSFAVRQGEVLGIAGLMGAGRSDLVAALFGAHAGRVSGEIVVDGAPARIRTPSDAIERGIAFVTEDRKRFGLVLEHAVLANMTLAGLARVAGRVFVDGDRERAAAGRVARGLRAPARFSILVGLTLAILAGYGVARMMERWPSRKVAPHRAPRPPARRADAGHRRRREAGDLRADRGARPRRARHRARLVGAARGARPLGPGDRAARRPRRRGVRARRGDARGRDGVRGGRGRMTSRISITALRAYTMLGALVVLWLYFHWATDATFLAPRNFSNLMRQTAVTGILAVGMLMVIVAGQIDLSVGSLVGLTGGVVAILQAWMGWGLVPALLAGVGAGLAIGALQGAVVAYGHVPAFIVTLGGLLAWRGVVKGATKGNTIPVANEGFNRIGQEYLDPWVGWALAGLAIVAIVAGAVLGARARKRHGLEPHHPAMLAARVGLPAAGIVGFVLAMNGYRGIPLPVVVLVAIALAGAVVTRTTTFGRYLYAIGGNPDAARLSGINLNGHVLAVFAVMGALAGVAGVVYTARLGSAAPDAGVLLELDAIAACVIGGASLMGGRGTVLGACLGALFMASLDNGLSLRNVEDFNRDIVKGVILVAAVGFDMLGRRRG